MSNKCTDEKKSVKENKENLVEEVENEDIETCDCKDKSCDLKDESEVETKDEIKNNSEKECESDKENREKEFEDMLSMSKKKNEKLEKELGDVKEKLLRTLAEYDNYRKRTAKEKEDIYTNACEDVLKEMLPVLDNLERAYKVEGSIEDIKKGIEMTVKQFNTSLEKLGVEEIKSDEKFDPNYHNAVMHIDDENYGETEIAEVFQKGYKKGEKVIRYSMVKVAN